MHRAERVGWRAPDRPNLIRVMPAQGGQESPESPSPTARSEGDRRDPGPARPARAPPTTATPTSTPPSRSIDGVGAGLRGRRPRHHRRGRARRRCGRCCGQVHEAACGAAPTARSPSSRSPRRRRPEQPTIADLTGKFRERPADEDPAGRRAAWPSPPLAALVLVVAAVGLVAATCPPYRLPGPADIGRAFWDIRATLPAHVRATVTTAVLGLARRRRGRRGAGRADHRHPGRPAGRLPAAGGLPDDPDGRAGAAAHRVVRVRHRAQGRRRGPHRVLPHRRQHGRRPRPDRPPSWSTWCAAMGGGRAELLRRVPGALGPAVVLRRACRSPPPTPCSAPSSPSGWARSEGLGLLITRSQTSFRPDQVVGRASPSSPS